jgi:YD repeat-containing protein
MLQGPNECPGDPETQVKYTSLLKPACPFPSGANSSANFSGRVTMIKTTFATAALMMLIATAALAEPQTRVYDARGNSVGTAVPQGESSVRYYDARGNSLGTTTTNHGTTTFYGPGGNVTGRAVAPSPSFGRGR